MTDQHEHDSASKAYTHPAVPPASSQPARPANGLMAVRDELDKMLPGGYFPWLMATIIIIVVLAVMFSIGHP